MMQAMDTTAGTLREVQRRSAWVLALAMVVSVLGAPGSARAQTAEPRVCDDDADVAIEFSDVAADSVFCVAIGEFADLGITVGRDDGTFGAGDPVTRGAMAAFLYRLAGSPDGPFDDPGFSDVGAGSTFETEIAWLATTGVTVGRGDGTFAPDGTVTRGAMAAFLTRYLDADLPILPEPAIDPVTLDLFADSDEFRYEIGGNTPTGTGASFEQQRRGPHGFGVRTFAWHGAKGSVRLEGRLLRGVSAEPVFEDMPEHVTALTAELSYEIDAQAELKGPWDRTNAFLAQVIFDQSRPATTLVSLSGGNDDEVPILRTPPGTHTGTMTTTLTRDRPGVLFIVTGRCDSDSGSQVFAFFNEGYCDALERGGIDLRSLSVTYTPIIDD